MQVSKLLLGLCVCLFMASCSESEKARLSRLVNEWEGKEILFPARSIFTVQGKDTVDFEFRDAEYKIVTYVASCGCTRVEYSKEPVRPGGTLELKVTYAAEHAGFFHKTLTVYCNTEDSPLRLSVKGNAEN